MKWVVAFLLAVVSAASPVAAAPPVPDRPDADTSTRVRPKWVDAHYDIRKTLAELARCSVGAERDRSIALLLHAYSPLTETERQLITPECLVFATWGPDFGPRQMQISPTVVQFVFADEVFRRELADSNPIRFVSAAPLDQPQFDKTPYYRLGECVVRANPVGAKALLSTKVESGDEARVFVQLLQAISNCQLTGQKLSLDKADVRGTVALNYVRLAAATGQLATRQRAR